MPYTVEQIKMFAYNHTEQPDFKRYEVLLYRQFVYFYDCFREGYDKDAMQPLINTAMHMYYSWKWEEEEKQKGGENYV